ncbi:hypothetical protein FOMPIDRAFT_88512 [Fomitopsis schrenkii]|uniref:Uncharacterized protein n=1 Tax=Fomitopsis schrenkii TaxID=2126942 RepID=S8DQI1_FOMSC|nr:hypothetical protein FOMPIDRAFT_88512 [Fomitopsis schrenkii]
MARHAGQVPLRHASRQELPIKENLGFSSRPGLQIERPHTETPIETDSRPLLDPDTPASGMRVEQISRAGLNLASSIDI